MDHVRRIKIGEKILQFQLSNIGATLVSRHQATSIFVGGLDPNVTDEHLRQVFSQHGQIIHVKIPAGKRCGFVQFADRYNTELTACKDLSTNFDSIPIDSMHFRLRERERELRSFENSYIPENPRTPKPLTFSKNRLRGAKNRSNISPVAKKFSEKTTFFFQKLCICANFFFVHMCTEPLQHIFKERIVMIKNVLEGFEVGFLKGITEIGGVLGFSGIYEFSKDPNTIYIESRSFENSYIPENPRTPKPLTFSKNRLRGAKNRSNISPVAKKKFRKNDFFFSKNFAYVQTFFLCICAQSLYNTYLKRFRILMIKNVLEGSEVGFLKGITVWEI
ncbi:hypothetical protein LXL04_010055 [Taraxacum kok-saghyz]